MKGQIAINSIISAKSTHFQRLFKKTICVMIVFCFVLNTIFPPQLFAQGILNLPKIGTMVPLSPAFQPIMLKGLKLYPDNPLKFDFIVDAGEEPFKDEKLRSESEKLIKYFLASLTVPENELWVNLSPYEKNRIIPESFGQTDMGKDLLSQDYILKQLTASLMYPESDLGKNFWERVHKKIYEQFGKTDVPMDTFNKVWIVPDKAVVYQHEQSAFVAEAHLKVMQEEDYKAISVIASEAKQSNEIASSSQKNAPRNDTTAVTQIIREIIIPEIEKEVNQGKNFAQLRQIYNSLILAAWFKKTLKESFLGQVYMDKNKVNGIDIADKNVKQKIYDQYIEAFKKGVYNYIKEDYDPQTQSVIPRKYVSGGGDFAMMLDHLEISDKASLGEKVMNEITDAAMFTVTTGLETPPVISNPYSVFLKNILNLSKDDLRKAEVLQEGVGTDGKEFTMAYFADVTPKINSPETLLVTSANKDISYTLTRFKSFSKSLKGITVKIIFNENSLYDQVLIYQGRGIPKEQSIAGTKPTRDAARSALLGEVSPADSASLSEGGRTMAGEVPVVNGRPIFDENNFWRTYTDAEGHLHRLYFVKEEKIIKDSPRFYSIDSKTGEKDVLTKHDQEGKTSEGVTYDVLMVLDFKKAYTVTKTSGRFDPAEIANAASRSAPRDAAMASEAANKFLGSLFKRIQKDSPDIHEYTAFSEGFIITRFLKGSDKLTADNQAVNAFVAEGQLKLHVYDKRFLSHVLDEIKAHELKFKVQTFHGSAHPNYSFTIAAGLADFDSIPDGVGIDEYLSNKGIEREILLNTARLSDDQARLVAALYFLMNSWPIDIALKILKDTQTRPMMDPYAEYVRHEIIASQALLAQSLSREARPLTIAIKQLQERITERELITRYMLPGGALETLTAAGSEGLFALEKIETSDKRITYTKLREFLTAQAPIFLSWKDPSGVLHIESGRIDPEKRFNINLDSLEININTSEGPKQIIVSLSSKPVKDGMGVGAQIALKKTEYPPGSMGLGDLAMMTNANLKTSDAAMTNWGYTDERNNRHTISFNSGRVVRLGEPQGFELNLKGSLEPYRYFDKWAIGITTVEVRDPAGKIIEKSFLIGDHVRELRDARIHELAINPPSSDAAMVINETSFMFPSTGITKEQSQAIFKALSEKGYISNGIAEVDGLDWGSTGIPGVNFKELLNLDDGNAWAVETRVWARLFTAYHLQRPADAAMMNWEYSDGEGNKYTFIYDPNTTVRYEEPQAYQLNTNGKLETYRNFNKWGIGATTIIVKDKTGRIIRKSREIGNQVRKYIDARRHELELLYSSPDPAMLTSRADSEIEKAIADAKAAYSEGRIIAAKDKLEAVSLMLSGSSNKQLIARVTWLLKRASIRRDDMPIETDEMSMSGLSTFLKEPIAEDIIHLYEENYLSIASALIIEDEIGLMTESEFDKVLKAALTADAEYDHFMGFVDDDGVTHWSTRLQRFLRPIIRSSKNTEEFKKIQKKALKVYQTIPEIKPDVYEADPTDQDKAMIGGSAEGVKKADGQQIRRSRAIHDQPSISQAEKDNAQSTAPGGIDLNPSMLNMQTKGTAIRFDQPFDAKNLQNIQINGFRPIIINIQPLTNVPMLLGVAEPDPVDRPKVSLLK